jgi:4-amino-4-deoxy-L-arabinose transferase-like glycosyltransferase
VQLAAIVTVSTCVRFALARNSPIPWLMPDELVYAGLGRQLAEGQVTPSLWAYGPLYPLLIAPFERLLSPQRAFEAIQLFNAGAFSLAAVPAFSLARRVLSRDRAIAAAAFVLLVPGGFYTSRAMTEAVAYPLALCALLAIVRAVERQTLRAQALAVTAIGIASCARIELLGLAAVFPVTAAALALRDRRALPARSLWSLLRPYRVLVALGIAGAPLLYAVALRGSVASSHGFAMGGCPRCGLPPRF